MISKFSNKFIDDNLIDRQIIRLEDAINSFLKIEFKCLICDYIWKARPSNIVLLGRGCPKCAGRTPLSNEEVDFILKQINMIRVGVYKNKSTNFEIQCLVDNCKYIWSATLTNILRGTSCPRCNKVAPLDNIYIDNKLINRYLKRLEDVKKTSDKISWQCLICNFIWLACPNKIIDSLRGCPKCGGSYPLDNNEVDKKILDLNIKRIGSYINKETKIEFQCLKCKNIWKCVPGSILNGGSGCPICNKAGVNEKRIFQILKNEKINFKHEYQIKYLNDSENKKYRLDFYIPEKRIAIEYNGLQHYQFVNFGNISDEKAKIAFDKQKARDIYINNFCKDNNISIIWIDGRKYCGKKLINYFNVSILDLLK